MSVERITPLGQAATDAPFMRAVPGAGHPRSSSAFPQPPAPPTPPEAAPHLYDSLALPLHDGAAADERLFPTALVRHFYKIEAARAQIEPLVDGALPEAVLRRDVETLLREAAAARGVDVARLIAQAAETPPERLPSRNLKGARYSFRGRLAAAGEDERLRRFDLYLTRIGARQWEAAVFERDPSRAGQIFPRAAPLLEAHRLVIDQATGVVLACVAQHIPTPGLATRAALFPSVAWRAILYPAIAAVAGLLVARFLSAPAAALLLIAAAVFAVGSKSR